jgi:hypothetical protein
MKSSEAVTVLKQRQSLALCPFLTADRSLFCNFFVTGHGLWLMLWTGFSGRTVHKCSIFLHGTSLQLVINAVSGQKEREHGI